MAHRVLNLEQQKIVEIIKTGSNIFFTGQAGTGKSTVLKALALKEENGAFYTAPTGKAAQNIGGRTIHSFAGIRLGNECLVEMVHKAKQHPAALRRWRKCKILVIDEVSMLSASLFDKLDAMAKTFRQCDEPFGGIQLVLCGDFSQLPPVTAPFAPEKEKPCFKALSWDETIKVKAKLTKVMRQDNALFLEHLNIIRNGNLTEFTLDFLKSLQRPILINEQVISLDQTVTLFSKRFDCFLFNNERLNALPENTEMIYKAEDSGNLSNLDALCQAPRELRLRVGARVLLLKNLSKTLVNGSCGTVVGFSYGNPVVHFDDTQTMTMKKATFTVQTGNDESLLATRVQLPLSLGWAITIHKSQGMTIPYLRVSLSGLFVHGQGYTAISRGVCPENIEVIDMDSSLTRIRLPEEVVTFNSSVLPVLEVDIPERRIVQACNEMHTLFDVIGNNDVEYNQDVEIIDLNMPHLVLEPPNSVFEYLKTELEKSALHKNTKLDVASCYAPEGSIFLPPVELFLGWVYNEIVFLTDLTITDGELVVGLLDKGKIESVLAPGFHKLLLSENTVVRWKTVSHLLAVNHNIELKDSRLLMTVMMRQILRSFVSYLYKTAKSNDTITTPAAENTDDATAELTPEMKGTVRYVAGWVLRKEKLKSTKYIQRNINSKSKGVRARVELERAILSTLSGLQQDKSVESVIPDSMERIQHRDRGGLTNVNDSLYLFFEEVQKHCDCIFTLNLVHRPKPFRAIAEARNAIQYNMSIIQHWKCILEPEVSSKCCIEAYVYSI